jgi:hypothetical protein
MVLIARTITNASSTESLPLLVPGYDPENPVTLAPSATLDLLTVVSGETLHAMKDELSALVAANAIIVVASIDSSALFPASLYSYIASNDTQIVFNPSGAVVGGPHATGFTIAVQVENAAGGVDTFDSSTTVVVSVTGGTATGPLLNAHASPITVTMSGGVAHVLVTATSSGTVILGLSSPSRTLTVSSTATITFS